MAIRSVSPAGVGGAGFSMRISHQYAIAILCLLTQEDLEIIFSAKNNFETCKTLSLIL